MKRIIRFSTVFFLSVISLTGGWLLVHFISGYIFTNMTSSRMAADHNVAYASNEITVQATMMPLWANGNVWFIVGLSLVIAAYFNRKPGSKKTKKAVLRVA